METREVECARKGVQVLFMDYLTCLGYNPPKASIRIIASSSSRLRGCYRLPCPDSLPLPPILSLHKERERKKERKKERKRRTTTDFVTHILRLNIRQFQSAACSPRFRIHAIYIAFSSIVCFDLMKKSVLYLVKICRRKNDIRFKCIN